MLEQLHARYNVRFSCRLDKTVSTILDEMLWSVVMKGSDANCLLVWIAMYLSRELEKV